MGLMVHHHFHCALISRFSLMHAHIICFMQIEVFAGARSQLSEEPIKSSLIKSLFPPLCAMIDDEHFIILCALRFVLFNPRAHSSPPQTGRQGERRANFSAPFRFNKLILALLPGPKNRQSVAEIMSETLKGENF
jgi:hypothetical protein